MNKKAIIKANKPIASTKANPKIEYENNCPFKEGFLLNALINELKTLPIPNEVPPKANTANPAAINLAQANILIFFYRLKHIYKNKT